MAARHGNSGSDTEQGPAGEAHAVILMSAATTEHREVGAMAAVSRQRVHDALAPVVTAAGYDLEDVTVTAAGRRSVVRVVVDRDGGVDLDAIANVSRSLSAALDDNDVMGQAPFVLEVTSPGVDRPLTQPRHWRRAAGRLVGVKVPEIGQLTGRVTGADEDKVTLDVGGDVRTFAYTDLGPGHVQVEFTREDS
jgi:ribosome maturation factor RimP